LRPTIPKNAHNVATSPLAFTTKGMCAKNNTHLPLGLPDRNNINFKTFPSMWWCAESVYKHEIRRKGMILRQTKCHGSANLRMWDGTSSQ